MVLKTGSIYTSAIKAVMPSYSSLQTKKQEHIQTHTHLREREQVHEFADEEKVVAVIGAEVRAQQREIL